MILTPFTNHDELHQYNQNYTRNNSRVKQTHLQKCKFQVHQFLSNLYIINISPSEQQKCSVHELRYESSQQPFAHLKHHRSVKEIRSQFTSLKGKKIQRRAVVKGISTRHPSPSAIACLTFFTMFSVSSSKLCRWIFCFESSCLSLWSPCSSLWSGWSFESSCLWLSWPVKICSWDYNYHVYIHSKTFSKERTYYQIFSNGNLISIILFIDGKRWNSWSALVKKKKGGKIWASLLYTWCIQVAK